MVQLEGLMRLLKVNPSNIFQDECLDVLLLLSFICQR